MGAYVGHRARYHTGFRQVALIPAPGRTRRHGHRCRCVRCQPFCQHWPTCRRIRGPPVDQPGMGMAVLL